MLAQVISNVAGQFDYYTDYYPWIKEKFNLHNFFFSPFLLSVLCIWNIVSSIMDIIYKDSTKYKE